MVFYSTMLELGHFTILTLVPTVKLYNRMFFFSLFGDYKRLGVGHKIPLGKYIFSTFHGEVAHVLFSFGIVEWTCHLLSDVSSRYDEYMTDDWFMLHMNLIISSIIYLWQDQHMILHFLYDIFIFTILCLLPYIKITLVEATFFFTIAVKVTCH
ncbi:hypothetical protein ACJX0J_017697, partial [Zea mays]